MLGWRKRLLALGGVLMGALAVALWSSDPGWEFRARHSSAGAVAAEQLNQRGCQPPQALGAGELAALLLQDHALPDCSTQAFAGLLAAADDVRLNRVIRDTLRRDRGSDRLRLRAALTVLIQSPGQALDWHVEQELTRARSATATRTALAIQVAERLGPEVLTLHAADAPDPNGRLAAIAFAAGDVTRRQALADALHRELRRPYLPDPGAAEPALAAELTLAGLTGLGLTPSLLRDHQQPQGSGVTAAQLPPPLAALLERSPGVCEAPAALACAELVLRLLDAAPPRHPADQMDLSEPSLPNAPGSWPPLQPHAAAPELLQAMMPWIRQGESAGRVLAAVAAPTHHFGDRACQAGQWGDPSDALRYGRSTPGATGLAAALLALGSSTELSVYATPDGVELQAASQRVRLGPCGESLPPSQDAPQVLLDVQALLQLANMERVAGAMSQGDLQRALELDAQLLAPPEAYATLRASLLAGQGILDFSLDAAGAPYALAWARRNQQLPLATLIEQRHPNAAATLKRLRSAPSACACSTPMTVLPPESPTAVTPSASPPPDAHAPDPAAP